MKSLLRLLRRDPLATITRATLGVLRDLEAGGCQILSAAVLPRPAVKIDRPPRELFDTYGYRQPLPGVPPYPQEYVAHLRGVRITWIAAPGASQPYPPSNGPVKPQRGARV